MGCLRDRICLRTKKRRTGVYRGSWHHPWWSAAWETSLGTWPFFHRKRAHTLMASPGSIQGRWALLTDSSPETAKQTDVWFEKVSVFPSILFSKMSRKDSKILPAWFRGQFASGPRATLCLLLWWAKLFLLGRFGGVGQSSSCPFRSFVVTLHGRDSKVQQTLQEQQPSPAWNWIQLLQWDPKDTWLGGRSLVLIHLVGMHAWSPCFMLGSAQKKS